MFDFQEAKRVLGRPYYENENVLLYNGDCVELMKQIASKVRVDLTVTSPPYNIGKEYEVVVSLDKYVAWSKKWIDLVHEITSENGAFWLNLGYVSIPNKAKAVPLSYLLWDKIPFFLIQEVVWNYAAGVAGKTFLSPRNEKFLWHVKNQKNYVFNLDAIRDTNVKYPNQKKNGKLKCNPLGKNPTDVWQISKVTSGKDRSSSERTSHPAQFPIELISRIIRASTNENQTIFDPFLGSGSSAVAAIMNKRKVIGFEVRKDYLDITIKRVEIELSKVSNLPNLKKSPDLSGLENRDQFELC